MSAASSRRPRTASATARGGASSAVAVALAAQAVTPVSFRLQPPWLVPSIGMVLMLVVLIAGRRLEDPRHPVVRRTAVALAGTLALGNLAMVARLVHGLLSGAHVRGADLVAVGAICWVTNVVAFGICLWEVDAGGPGARAACDLRRHGELLFPQYSLPGHELWAPTFGDYLYVSFTNAAAFSPTDSLPLSRRMKLLMAVQSAVALVAVAVVFARGVNILAG